MSVAPKGGSGGTTQTNDPEDRRAIESLLCAVVLHGCGHKPSRNPHLNGAPPARERWKISASDSINPHRGASGVYSRRSVIRAPSARVSGGWRTTLCSAWRPRRICASLSPQLALGCSHRRLCRFELVSRDRPGSGQGCLPPRRALVRYCSSPAAFSTSGGAWPATFTSWMASLPRTGQSFISRHRAHIDAAPPVWRNGS